MKKRMIFAIAAATQFVITLFVVALTVFDFFG